MLQAGPYRPAVLTSLYDSYCRVKSQNAAMRSVLERLRSELVTLQEGWRLANPGALVGGTVVTPGMAAASTLLGSHTPKGASGAIIEDDDSDSGWSEEEDAAMQAAARHLSPATKPTPARTYSLQVRGVGGP